MIKIVVDNREKQPWSFGEFAEVTHGTLRTGDYAVQFQDPFGLWQTDQGFAIERKSMDDFLGTISSDWGRFQREIRRAVEAGFVLLIVVEGCTTDFLYHYSVAGMDVVQADMWKLVKAIEDYLGTELPKNLVAPINSHPNIGGAFVLKRITDIFNLGGFVVFADNALHASILAFSFLRDRFKLLNPDEP